MRQSDYVTILCGEFNDNYTPLTRAGFWALYHKYNDSMDELVSSEEPQVKELLKRSASITFAIAELRQRGLRITTFLDNDFPKRLFTRLGDFCPPLLYTCGNYELSTKRTVGYVGSRSITELDAQWTEARIEKNINDGYGIVTGGAKGIDSVALSAAINAGSFAIVYLPDNIGLKIREAYFQQALLAGRLLLYSHVSPLAKKNKNSFVSSAMERNKFIYAQSIATVVVRSDLNKGGTWSGATEALRHKWSRVYAWDNVQYPGNQKLIEMGALPLSDDGKPVARKKSDEVNSNVTYVTDKQIAQQGSLFDKEHEVSEGS